MMENLLFQAQVNKTIKHMGVLSHTTFTIRDLERDLKLPNETVRKIRDYLWKHGYIQERFTTNLIDPEGKSEITYRLTPKGMNRFREILREESRAKEQARRHAEYQEEKERTKKSNRRWLIGCTIAFIVMMTVMILVGISF